MTDAPKPAATPGRVAAIDAYRGFVMLLMMAEVLHLARTCAKRSRTIRCGDSSRCHQTHVEWTGCSLHDLIQPSFSFLVGVALPFSLAARRRAGQSFAVAVAARRSGGAILLIFLGVFLRSTRQQADELHLRRHAVADRPGLLLPLLDRQSPPARAVARARRHPHRLLGGVRGLPAAWPDFDPATVGVKADWPHHPTGFAAHWDKNTNLPWALRPLVPQPVPAREAVHAQRRRLRHPQLHPDPGNDDPRSHRRRLAPLGLDLVRQVRADGSGWGRVHRARTGAGRPRASARA